MTLREYIIFWQETYDSHQSRPTTYAAHNYVFKNHILPGLGDIPLSELTSEMVGEFLEERRRFGNHRPGSSGLGEETMRHIHRLLQQCLDQAIRDGLLTENPAKAFRYRKSTTVKANIMTPLEMEDYLDAAEQLGYLPMFMLALTTGLRQGELIALKWSDLDIESRTLTIAENRAVVRRELVEHGTLEAVLQTEVQHLAWVRGERPERFALRGAETQPQRQPRFADLRRACQQVQSLGKQIVDHEGGRLVSGALQRVRVNGLQSFDLRHKKPPDKRIRAETSLQSRL